MGLCNDLSVESCLASLWYNALAESRQEPGHQNDYHRIGGSLGLGCVRPLTSLVMASTLSDCNHQLVNISTQIGIVNAKTRHESRMEATVSFRSRSYFSARSKEAKAQGIEA